jgi:prevent-host-death family protein
MTRVGVRQLRNRLSEQLRAVKAGEEILVTEHGEDIARLTPVVRAPAWLLQLVASGAARWEGGKPAGLTTSLHRSRKLASDYVIEMRR